MDIPYWLRCESYLAYDNSDKRYKAMIDGGPYDYHGYYPHIDWGNTLAMIWIQYNHSNPPIWMRHDNRIKNDMG